MCSPCPPFQRRRPGRAVCVVDRKRVVKVHTGSALLDPRVNRRSALCTPGGSAVNFSQAAFTLYNARSVLFPSSLCLHGAPFGPSSESSSVYRGRDFCPLFRIAPPHTAAHAHRDRHATRVRPRPGGQPTRPSLLRLQYKRSHMPASRRLRAVCRGLSSSPSAGDDPITGTSGLQITAIKACAVPARPARPARTRRPH